MSSSEKKSQDPPLCGFFAMMPLKFTQGDSMAWQGVPFLFDKIPDAASVVPELAHLSLEKIPTVIVESSFSWETLLSSCIAGLIPATIAFLAIRNSNTLAVRQNKMQLKTKINEEIRIAAAKYVTAINFLAAEYKEWISNAIELRLHPISKAVMPEALTKNIYIAESSKNALLLLINPDEDGTKVINKIWEAQQALQPIFEATATYVNEKRIITVVNDLISSCHEYVQRNDE